MKLDLVIFEDKKVPEISKPVEQFNDKISQVVKAMFDTIRKHNGIGLAAIQIGVPLRIVIASVNSDRIVAINPKIIWTSETMTETDEGNLSLPGIMVKVSRPAEVEIQYQNLAGKEKTLRAKGLLAICLQHEIEQLDGITILSHRK